MEFVEVYDYYWNQKADPRTANLPFIGSPVLIPLILLSYLYFVLKSGPELMKNRKPYNLKAFVKCYNIFQIIANAYLVQQYISAGWFTEIGIFCELPDYSYKPAPLKLTYVMWLSMMLKLVDLLETVVFILRKKNRQVSFLHVYHHVSTPMLCWYIVKYFPVGMASFTLLLNCTVHVIMYTYYFLSSFGEKIQKILNPYKPIITAIQMVQFVVLILHTGQSYLPNYCPVTKYPGSISMINLIINFYLFYNFYQKRYQKSGQKKS